MLAQSPDCDFTKYDSNVLVYVPSKIEPKSRAWETSFMVRYYHKTRAREKGEGDRGEEMPGKGVYWTGQAAGSLLGNL